MIRVLKKDSGKSIDGSAEWSRLVSTTYGYFESEFKEFFQRDEQYKFCPDNEFNHVKKLTLEKVLIVQTSS